MKSKRIFIMLTVMMIVLSVVASSYQIGENRKFQPNQSVNVSEKYETNIATAHQSSERLMNFFRDRDKEIGNINKDFQYMVNGIHYDAFPDYYAGQYISVDGNLVIMLTEEYKDGLFFESAKARTAKEEIVSVTGQKDIMFTTAKYSMKELVSAMNDIYLFAAPRVNSQEEYQITGFWLDDAENKVGVNIYPYDEEAEQWFKQNVLDKPFIFFKETKPGAVEATATIRPGGIIKAENENSYFSVGFRAYKGNTEGFVTCGHSFQTVYGDSNIMNANNNVLGISYENERKFNDMLDAAFVRKSSGNTFVNTIYDSYDDVYTVTTGYIVPNYGDLVYMCGENTSSQDGTLLSGAVMSSSATAIYNGEMIVELYSVGYYANLGDSGGIVFKKDGSLAKTVGIQIARDNNTGCSYVCKAENIVSEFGLTIK